MGTNMRKLLYGTLIFLLFCAYAEAGTNAYIAGSNSGLVYTDCSAFPSGASFFWTGDYSGDTDKGCKSASTTLDGTISGGSVVNSASDPGVVSPTSGGNVYKQVTDGNYYIRWPVTTGDIFSGAEGRICMDIYLASSAYGTFYLGRANSSNEQVLGINSGNDITASHEGSDVVTSITTSATIPDATWTNVCLRWSVTNNKLSVKIGAGSYEDDIDTDAVTELSGASYVYFGYQGSLSGTIYMDNFTIYKTSGL